jgi:hypothetical protein
MDLYRVIRELVQERDRIDRIIRSLEEAQLSSKSIAKAGLRKRRGRKSMDEAARKDVSERMKRYWARRREEQARQAPTQGESPKTEGANGSD